MKKIDTFNFKKLKPRKETVEFILNFSKSLEFVKTKQGQFVLVKN